MTSNKLTSSGFEKIYLFLSPYSKYFKYSVYLLLALNVVLFLREEWEASRYVFGDHVRLEEIIRAFAASIDTLAWLLLLLLFELETYQIPDDKLTPKIALAIHTFRMVCYGVIVYAFYGYLTKALNMDVFHAFESANVCGLVDQKYAVMTSLDKYTPLTLENCISFVGHQSFINENSSIIATSLKFNKALWLIWLDVINSSTWILVVVNLEFDIRMTAKQVSRNWLVRASHISKGVLYFILVSAAVYWGFEDDFLPFWDAMLWIIAFMFIELNLFEWQQELEEENAKSS